MISSNALSSKLGTNNEVYSQAKETFTYIIILVNKQLLGFNIIKFGIQKWYRTS